MLVGRLDELGRCIRGLERVAAAATAGAVVVEGDAGMGKTSLVDAVLEEAARTGFTVVHGRSHALGAGVAYGPMAAALGRYLHALAGDDRARLIAGLTSLARLVEGIGDPPTPSDPDLERARLFQAVALLLGRMAADRPVVVAVDDLHWADAASVELLEFLAAELASERVAILVALRPGDAAARPDVRHLVTSLLRQPGAARVDVGPLRDSDLAALIEDRLGGPASPTLRRELEERTGGVVLAIDAVLRGLNAAGALVPARGGWEAAAPLVVPEYAVDLFADRLRALDAAAADAVATLAVADEPLELGTIAAMAGADEPATAAALAAGVDAGLVRECDVARWEVAHPLVAEAAAGRLGAGERRRLHLAFAQLLASGGDAVLDSRARHAVGAGSLLADDVAADVLGRAGQRALRRGAMDTAARWLSAAAVRAAAADLPPSEVAHLLLDAAGSWERRHELDAAMAAYGEAAELLAGCDPAGAGLAAIMACRISWQLGRPEVDAWRSRAMALAAQAPLPARLRIHYELHGALLRQQRMDEAGLVAGYVRDDLAVAPPGPVAAAAAFRLVVHEVFTGGTPAERIVEEAPTLPPGSPVDLLVNVEGPVLDALVLLGRWDDARRRAAVLLELVGRDVAVSGLSWRAVIARVHASVATGAWTEATDLLTELTGDAAVIRASRSFWVGVLAALHGDLGGARAEVGAARQVVQSSVHAPHAAALRILDAYLEHLDGGAPTDVGPVGTYHAMNHGIVSALAAEVLAVHGQGAQALAIADGLRARGAAGTLPTVEADRITAIVTGDAAALAAAADGFERLGMPFETARARLEAAERDRGLGIDVDALLATFDGLGAEPWASRARALLGPDTPTAPAAPRDLLTPREREIATLVTEGLTNAQIAERLTISIRTVTSHLDHAYTKLGVGSRAALATYVTRSPSVEVPT